MFLSLSDVVLFLVINVIMPTIVDILTFMSRINFVLSWVEHEKSFITPGPDCKFTSGSQETFELFCMLVVFHYFMLYADLFQNQLF